MDIGERIKLARYMRGMTQQELADKLGISASTVSRWEGGRLAVAPGMICELARALDVRVEMLIRVPILFNLTLVRWYREG